MAPRDQGTSGRCEAEGGSVNAHLFAIKVYQDEDERACYLVQAADAEAAGNAALDYFKDSASFGYEVVGADDVDPMDFDAIFKADA